MWREMRRKNQQLSQEECAQILATGKRGVLAVLGDDGYPYTVPLDYVFDDGRLFFHSAVEGHKLDAIRAYDKCSFCVLSEPEETEGEWWLTWKSVIAFGRVQVIDDEQRKLAYLTEIGYKYFPSEEEAEGSAARSVNRVEMLELTIEHLSGKIVKEK